ncbi:nucleoside diphosphate kinase regulator [Roseovarius sp. A-2]|uniref:hypothetical protein n=1 Tax=Roseovarius sp. A-2 TaxID=1570360 RepID=UPI0009B58C44|nr:hypothetical protein [Roseovarius sp. A-2]GAW36688.1 nucleoside diphosphate kinase regulator [Roseovarius sp. A-2]
MRTSNDVATFAGRSGNQAATIDSRAFGSVEAMRPIQSFLSKRDFWHLQQLRRKCTAIEGGAFSLLSHLIRAKLQDAHILNPAEEAGNVATLGSRVTFSIRETAPLSRTLFDDGFAHDQEGIPLKTFLGVTLLGMKVGQTVPLLNASGTTEALELVAIPWQVEPK